MIVSLEDFITKKIALSTADFPNESIKAVIDEIKSEGELDWITPDAEQSFFTCDDRPRYLFIQFNLMKDPQLNWSSVLFTNFWISRPISDLWLKPIKKAKHNKRYKVSVYKAVHHPSSIFYGKTKEELPSWLVDHDGEEVYFSPHDLSFSLINPPSGLAFNFYWVEEMEEN